MRIFVANATAPGIKPDERSFTSVRESRPIYAESENELATYARLTNFLAELNRGASPADAGTYYPADAFFVFHNFLNYDRKTNQYSLRSFICPNSWEVLCKGESKYQADRVTRGL